MRKEEGQLDDFVAQHMTKVTKKKPSDFTRLFLFFLLTFFDFRRVISKLDQGISLHIFQIIETASLVKISSRDLASIWLSQSHWLGSNFFSGVTVAFKLKPETVFALIVFICSSKAWITAVTLRVFSCRIVLSCCEPKSAVTSTHEGFQPYPFRLDNIPYLAWCSQLILLFSSSFRSF